MTEKTTHRTPITGYMRQISLSILMPFFRKNDSAPERYAKYESSIFSQPDQSELLAMEEEICPLVEAEVYLIYGRRHDAEKVLAEGVQAGRISTAEVTQFWGNQRKGSGRVS